MTDQEKIHNVLMALTTTKGQRLLKNLKEANIWLGVGFMTLGVIIWLGYYLGMNLIESYL